MVTLLRIGTVLQHSGISRSSLYQHISNGLWPKPVLLGARSVGWPADEIDAINAARVAGESDDEIRRLVQALEAGRKGKVK